LTLCIGGDKIDWNIPGSVNTVFELLGVGKSSVYEYRKVKELKFKPHDRKRRRTALDQMPWWDHASAVMETFWEENCDEVPDADNPAEKHDYTVKENHRFDSLPDNPDVTKRVCVRGHFQSWYTTKHAGGTCFMLRMCVQVPPAESMPNGMLVVAILQCIDCSCRSMVKNGGI